MLANPARTSTRVLVLVAALVLAASAGFALRVLTADNGVEGSGTLEIGGVVYDFALTTCTITDSDFLTAGAGEVDGEDFWFSASPYTAGLTLGTSQPPGQSEGERFWMSSVGEIIWQRTGNSVVADLTMEDERRLDAPQLRGQLSATCG